MSHNPTVDSPGPAHFRARPWLAAGLCALALALALRYGLFQSRTVGKICIEATRPQWCAWRDAIGMIHGFWLWGWTGVAAAVAGFWTGRRWALALGLIASIFALVVYNTELGAIGLIVTLLRLARG